MILQVAPNARKVRDDLDSALLQQRGIADPGELEQLRRADRPGGEQNFAPRLRFAFLPVNDKRHAAGARPVEHDMRRERLGGDAQIRSARRRREVADGSAAAQSVTCADLQRRRAIRDVRIVIGDPRIA